MRAFLSSSADWNRCGDGSDKAAIAAIALHIAGVCSAKYGEKKRMDDHDKSSAGKRQKEMFADLYGGFFHTVYRLFDKIENV